jgi:hypothetical protein
MWRGGWGRGGGGWGRGQGGGGGGTCTSNKSKTDDKWPNYEEPPKEDEEEMWKNASCYEGFYLYKNACYKGHQVES